MDHENNSDKKSYRKKRVRKRRSQPDSSSESQPVRFEQIETDEGTKTVEVRRRRRRRTKQPKKEKEKKLKLYKKLILFSIPSLIIIILGHYFFMITWIGGQGFRKNVSNKVSEIIDQKVDFGEFSLNGLNLRSKKVKVHSLPKNSLLLNGNLELLQTRLSPLSFITKDWSMSNIQALEGKLLFGDDRFDLANRNTHLNEGDANEGPYKAGIGLDSSPDTFNFNRFWIEDCDLDWQIKHSETFSFIDGANVTFSEISSSGFNVDFKGGDFVIPLWPDLKIQSVSGTVKEGNYIVNQSKFGVSQNGEVTLSGSISLDRKAEYKFSSALTNVDTNDVLSSGWGEFFEGFLDGGIKISGNLLGEESMEAEGRFSGSDIKFFKNPILEFLSQSLSEPSFNQIRIDNLNFQFFRDLNLLEISGLSGDSLPLIKFNDGKIKISNNNSCEGTVNIQVDSKVLELVDPNVKKFFKIENDYASGAIVFSGSNRDLKVSFGSITN